MGQISPKVVPPQTLGHICPRHGTRLNLIILPSNLPIITKISTIKKEPKLEIRFCKLSSQQPFLSHTHQPRSIFVDPSSSELLELAAGATSSSVRLLSSNPDWSVQATVSWLLSESFGSKNVSIVAEEDVQSLSKVEAADLLESVVKTVNDCLAEAPRFGLQGPQMALGTSEVLAAISRCNSNGGRTGRFWALDPVDGTLGFVRGDQYAVALALLEDGEPVLGVLGCPNYPMRK